MAAAIATLEENIAAYGLQRRDLEENDKGRWVVFYDGELSDIFDDFQDAAAFAVEHYGRGPYLIRQIGAPPIQLPSSVLYRIRYDNS